MADSTISRTTAQSGTASSAVSLDHLLAQTGQNRALVADLVAILFDEVPERLADIRSGLGASDARGVERAAHRLRGSLQIFGAKVASAAASDLEQMGRRGDLSTASDRFADLERELADVLDALRAQRHELAL